MPSSRFTPHWRATGSGDLQGPFSWVFFAVVRVAGRHRPVAVVSSIGDNLATESLMGGPLAAACQRTITIFSDPANAPAVRAELTLAHDFYMPKTGEEHRPETVELPELDRRAHQSALRNRPWDHDAVAEFPFITACLLQGVGFDARAGNTRRARPEPLGTVYRDTSLEWGMVVVDITDLEAVCYGIVGFTVTPAVFVESEADARRRAAFRVMGPGAFEHGKLHMMDDVRPRRAMSAAEYLAKWPYDFAEDKLTVERLAGVPPIDRDAMALVWPPDLNLDGDDFPSLANLSVATDGPSENQTGTQQLIQNALNLHGFDTSILVDIPGFQDLLKRRLVVHSARLGNTPLEGRLIRLAFASQDHLSLELLPAVSIGAISAALRISDTLGQITSLSIHIDSISATSAEIAEMLARFDTLRAVYFVQTPGRASDTLSAQLLQELAARPQLLRRTKIMLAGAYSAALRKRFWLPTVPKAVDAVQVAPLDVFPVQQILSRVQISYPGSALNFSRSCIHLGDALLTPERLVSGLLLYFRTLILSEGTNGDGQGRQGLFSFSSCPSSLADDTLSAAEISPIPAENFALPLRPYVPNRGSEWWARMRDLVPGGWTVLVSVETHYNREVARRSRDTARSATAHCIRFAFVRPRRGRIAVDDGLPVTPLEVEAVGLQEFLAATAPDVDPALVDRRLRGLAEEMETWWGEAPLPRDEERLSVLPEGEAAEILKGFLEEARSVNKWLRHRMVMGEEDFKDRSWYPELLGDESSTSA